MPKDHASAAQLARSVTVSRILNIVALAAMIGVLSGSLYAQFAQGEQPCPLCMIQRVSMYGVALGPVMNLSIGIKVRHYAITILFAMVGAATSIRQILLHITPVPGQPTGFGPAILGLHMYTWAFVVFCVAIAGVSILLLWPTPFAAGVDGLLRERGVLRIVAVVVVAWLCAYLLIMTSTVVPECGIQQCPDNPTNTEPWLGVYTQ